MDAPAPAKPVTINRWLPYWAVLQSDASQTVRSWVYRVWVLVTVLATVGYLLYRVGVYREAGIVQNASALLSDLLRWSVFGSVALIVILTTGAVSAERGTMADSVLSRGISRHQYFLGKLHSRLVTVLVTFFILGGLALGCSILFLHEDLSAGGCLIAMATVAAFLMAVITCGVTVSAMVNNTLMGIVILWLVLYGGGFTLSLLPEQFPSPDRELQRLGNILRGYYDVKSLIRLVAWSAAFSCVTAVVGMVYFSRRDV